MQRAHDHLVTVDVVSGCVRVFRIMPDGERVLFTEYVLPNDENVGWSDCVTELAHALGEDLLMDSPLTRKRFSL